MGRAGRVLGAILILIGALVLVAALLSPWYTVKVTETSAVGSRTTTQNSYLGFPEWNGTVQYSCSSNPSCPSTTSYTGSHPPMNNTGALAETGLFLTVLGFVFAVIGAVLGIASRNNPRRAYGGVGLAVLALIVAILAVGLFYASLPSAIAKDYPASERFGSAGPWSTFMGSGTTTTPGVSISASWGPAMGWYLAIGAFAVLLIGATVLALSRRQPPSPVPTTVPAPSGQTSSPPSSHAPSRAVDGRSARPHRFSTYWSRQRLRPFRCNQRPWLGQINSRTRWVTWS